MTIESIEEWAFSNTGLKTIYFDGTEEQWNAVKKSFGWNNGMRGYEIICKNTENEEGIGTDSEEESKSTATETESVSK